MNKFKKIGLVTFYIIVWLLFIIDIIFVIAAFGGIKNGVVNGKVEWFAISVILSLPFLLGYLLRNHFKILAKLIVRFIFFIGKLILSIKNIKLTLPLTILLGCIILGSFFFATQVIKQKSIEKQQKLDLQVKALQNQMEKEQEHKEYVASRKKDCFDIYNKEKDNWNNTKGTEYDEKWDKCYVIYSDTTKRDKCVAPKDSDINTEWGTRIWNSYFDCLDKQFRKEF